MNVNSRLQDVISLSFFDDWWQIQKFYIASDMCTDDMWMETQRRIPENTVTLPITPEIHIMQEMPVRTFWQYRYKGILRSNVAIEQIPKVVFENESLKKDILRRLNS